MRSEGHHLLRLWTTEGGRSGVPFLEAAAGPAMMSRWRDGIKSRLD
jgi:hypothetical protein